MFDEASDECIEATNLRKLKHHPNILEYVEHFTCTGTNVLTRKTCIVSEYCEVRNVGAKNIIGSGKKF